MDMALDKIRELSRNEKKLSDKIVVLLSQLDAIVDATLDQDKDADALLGEINRLAWDAIRKAKERIQ